VRVGSDASNYLSITPATNLITFDAVGSGTPVIVFNDSVGIGVSPSAKLHVLSTTDQFRISYDGTQSTSFILASTGAMTVSTNTVPASGVISYTFTGSTPISGTPAPLLLVDHVGGGLSTVASSMEIRRNAAGATLGIFANTSPAQYIRFNVGGEPVVGPTTASGLLLQDLTSSPGTLLWRQYGNKSYTKGASTVPAKWQNWGAGVDIPEVTVPGTPDANDARFYAKDKAGVSNLYWKNDAGIEYDLSGVTSGGGTAVSLATLYLHMGS